jgi:hypothetical protein
MDYIFGSIMRHIDPRLRKFISYDIICQWWKSLMQRMQQLPPLVRMSIILALFRFVIPKMHIRGHTVACQEEFSLDLVPGSGQTDGEGIERPWASIGAIATSTRVSGPGARHDILDDHWSFWNWLKTTGLRELHDNEIYIPMLTNNYCCSCNTPPPLGHCAQGAGLPARGVRAFFFATGGTGSFVEENGRGV